MEPRVLNKYKDHIPKDAVYIGRPSKWGNPFTVGKDGNRDEICDKYSAWLDTQPELKEQAKQELKGKSLICYCAPLRCHGDTLLRISNEEMKNKIEMLVPWDPTQDGIDHINIYSKGKTILGRALSNFSTYGFVHPEYGKFASVEGFWYWASTGKQHHHLKSLAGFRAKELGRQLEKVDNPKFDREIEEVIKLKITQDPDLLLSFKASNLPFAHYYVYGNPPDAKVIADTSSIWLTYYHEKLRDILKGLNNGKFLRVIVAGSREIKDYNLVVKAIEDSGYNIGELVCGMAPGVDMLGHRYAKERHIPIKEMPADWDNLGKKAGMVRNFQMGDYADALCCIWNGTSSGTKSMWEYMSKLMKPFYLVRTDIGDSNA